MALVALLSNPQSTGNRALLPRVRSFCAAHRGHLPLRGRKCRPDRPGPEADRPREARRAGDQWRRRHRSGDPDRLASRRPFRCDAAAGGGASEREDQPDRPRSRRRRRPDRGARAGARFGAHRHGAAHRLARADRAQRRQHRRPGRARHVPGRGRARRHDPLLPAQNLSARPAQLAGPFPDLHARPGFGRGGAQARGCCRRNGPRSRSASSSAARCRASSPS